MNHTYFSINSLFEKTLDTLSHYQQVQLSAILAKDVLPNFEQKYPNDNRPRLAIEAAEKWLADPSNENAEKARRAAAYTSTYAAWGAKGFVWTAAYAAAEAARAAVGSVYYAAAYSSGSKFYNTIPNKQQFIKMLGKSR